MSNILIGWSEKDVSTDKPVNIPGQFHMRISRGIMDPLTCTALVLRSGGSSAIFLSVDLVVIRCGLYNEVMAKVAEKNPCIPSDKILMNATHTHTGASHYYFEGMGHFSGSSAGGIGGKENVELPHEMEIASSDEYREFLADRCADAICEAWDSASEGGIAWGYGYAVVSHSRRPCYSDGKGGTYAKMYGDTNDENFLGYEAGADHFTNMLYTFDAGGNLTGAIVNVPCPSQCSENEYMLSADYWHNTRSEIKKRHGEHVHILAQCAAGGDLSPRILHYKEAQKRRMRLKYGDTDYTNSTKALCERADIAERIADSFDEVLSWARKDIRTEAVVRHETREFMLTRRIPTEAEYNAAKAELERLGDLVLKTDGTPIEKLKFNSKEKTRGARQARVVTNYENKDDSKLPMKAHIIRIGDIAFASNRFELYMDFQHRIQARSPFEQTFIVQLAAVPGDEGGTYLATARGVDNKSYSACIFDNACSPEGGQELVEGTLEALSELAVD